VPSPVAIWCSSEPSRGLSPVSLLRHQLTANSVSPGLCGSLTFTVIHCRPGSGSRLIMRVSARASGAGSRVSSDQVEPQSTVRCQGHEHDTVPRVEWRLGSALPAPAVLALTHLIECAGSRHRSRELPDVRSSSIDIKTRRRQRVRR